MGCIFVINIHNNMKNSFLLVLLLYYKKGE